MKTEKQIRNRIGYYQKEIKKLKNLQDKLMKEGKSDGAIGIGTIIIRYNYRILELKYVIGKL